MTHTSRRMVPDQIGTSVRFAFAMFDTEAIAIERAAVGSQIRRSASRPPLHASQEASRPTKPTMISPQPDTAVNDVADSMVRLM